MREHWIESTGTWHLAVSLFGAMCRGRSCNSKPFVRLFLLRMSCSCVIIIIIIIIIRVSHHTHIQGLWHIIQYFLHSIASRYFRALNPSRGTLLPLLQTPPKPAVGPTRPPIHRTLGRPWRRADHWHASSARFKNEWSYIHLFPLMLSKRRQGQVSPPPFFFLPYCTSIPAHDMHSVMFLSVSFHNNASFSSATLCAVFRTLSVL